MAINAKGKTVSPRIRCASGHHGWVIHLRSGDSKSRNQIKNTISANANHWAYSRDMHAKIWHPAARAYKSICIGI